MTIPLIAYGHHPSMSFTPASTTYDFFRTRRIGLAPNFKSEQAIPAFAKLDSLKYWPEGFHTPGQSDINAAKSWVRDLYTSADSRGTWIEPNVTVSQDGEIVLEWWNHDQKLTIYVTSERAEYIKVWGSDMLNDMEDGIVQDSKMLRSLWMWLIG